MIVLLLVWTLDVGRLWRDVQAHFDNSRGVAAYQKKKYDEAAKAFGSAAARASTPQRQLNLGTSLVAAGDRERGAAALDKAMSDPRLRADALYNRGTSALAAKAYDSAIRDYVQALKLRPNDLPTKRNLEIARVQKRQAEAQAGGGQGAGRKNEPSPQASAPRPEQRQKSETDTDALLRSVQQQEQEELSRMHKAKGEKLRVGW